MSSIETMCAGRKKTMAKLKATSVPTAKNPVETG
jgi:hypothetical protein